MAESRNVVLKANLPRTRDLSFVGRFQHNYGFEDEMFEYLLHQKDVWGDKLFYLNENQLAKDIENGLHKMSLLEPGAQVLLRFPIGNADKISKEEYDAEFGSQAPLTVNVERLGKKKAFTIDPRLSIDLAPFLSRNVVAANVGGYVTAMRWLPLGASPVLVVAVMNGQDLQSTINHPALSIFPKHDTKGVTSSLQFWNYEPDLKTLVCSCSVLLPYGGTRDLRWLPVEAAGQTFGVLCGLFSDGKVHFFKVYTNAPPYLRAVEAAWTVTVRDELSGVIPITAFDILNLSTVLVGTLRGCIAEFVLPHTGADDVEVPSFVEHVADSAVTSLAIGASNGSHVILVNTATTQSFALVYEQLRQGRVDLNYTIAHVPPLYHKQYRIFIYPDSAESIGYTFARHPHQRHTLLFRTELVSSFHTSEYLNHPLAIVGNVCGDVFVVNIGRKLFGVPKAHNKLVVPLRLWRLAYDGQLSLNADYAQPQEKGDVKYSFTPPEVAVSATAWNEHMNGSSLYAFGTFQGLLVVERLDPEKL